MNISEAKHDEIEVKFYPIEPADIREKLKAIGATLVKPERVMRRTIYDRSANPSMEVTYIRVRDEGDVVRMSTKEYADESKGIKYQREIQVEVGDFDSANRILQVAGLVATNHQVTRREEWEIADCTVCIDFWPHLKPYIEIEGKTEEAMMHAAKMLGLRWEEHINGGALEVYMKQYGWDLKEAVEFTKELDFDRPLVRIP